MTSRDRSIVYYLFTLVFFIISPIILLYTSGYQFDSAEGRVQRSGMILLDVVPEDAKVLVNDHEVSNANRSRGAVRLPGLSEGNYGIRIEKDGYLAWSTSLAVRPGAVAAPSTIRLIRTTQAFLTLPLPLEIARTSPNEELLAGVIQQSSQRTLILVSTRAGNTIATVALPMVTSIPQDLLWSPDNQKIAVVEKRSSTRFVTVYDFQHKTLSKPLPILSLLAWESRSETLLTSNGKILRRILPFSQQLTSTTLPTPINDLISVDDHVYALTSGKTKTLSLTELHLNADTITKEEPVLNNVSLPAESRLLSVPNFPLIVKTPTLLLILEKDSKGIWSIAQELPAATSSRITTRQIITLDSNTFYQYSSDHTLLSIHSQVIGSPEQIFPIPASPWIAVATNHSLVLHKKPFPKEMIGDSTESMIRLDQAIDIHELITDPLGRLLLFTGTKDGQSGLFIRILSDSSAGPFGGR